MEPDPNFLVDLTDASSAQDAELIRATLEYAGITAFAFTLPGTMTPWELGSSKPYRVQVRRADVEKAKIELETLRHEQRNIDWDAQDLEGLEADDPAVKSESDPNWAENNRAKQSFAKTIILLATIPAFGLIGLFGVFAAAARNVMGDGAMENRKPDR